MASVNLEDNSSSDESKEPPHILYTDEFCDEALQTRGILWLTSLPPVESSPVRLSISDDEKQQNLNVWIYCGNMRPNKADYIHSTAHCKLEIMEKQPDLYVGENRRFFTNSSRVCMDFIFSDMS